MINKNKTAIIGIVCLVVVAILLATYHSSILPEDTPVTDMVSPLPDLGIIPGEIVVKYKTPVVGRNYALGQSVTEADANQIKGTLKTILPQSDVQVKAISGSNKALLKFNKAERVINVFPTDRLLRGSQTGDSVNSKKNPVTTIQTAEALIAELKKDPNVEYAEPNYTFSLNFSTNDPYLSNQSAMVQSTAMDKAYDLEAVSNPPSSSTEEVVIAVMGLIIGAMF